MTLFQAARVTTDSVGCQRLDASHVPRQLTAPHSRHVGLQPTSVWTAASPNREEGARLWERVSASVALRMFVALPDSFYGLNKI